MQLCKCFRFGAYALTLAGLAVHANANISGSAWLVPDNGTSGECAGNAVISCIPGSAANATFTLTNTGLTAGFNNGGLNDSGGSNGSADNSNIATLNAFINSDGQVVGGTGGVTYSANDSGGASYLDATWHNTTTGTAYGACTVTGSQNCGTIFEFTGMATFTNDESISVTADDGWSLYVGCTISTCTSANLVTTTGTGTGGTTYPGPESINTHSVEYTGSGGTLSFVFIYSECCSLPATLTTNLNVVNAPTPEPTSILLLGTVMFGVLKVVRRKYSA